MARTRYFLGAFGAFLVLAFGCLALVVAVMRNDDRVAAAEALRYASYKLADEVRHSSDDLTRMARTYVVTGDPRYEEYFNRILAIRDGRAPRPVDYENIYWDYVTATGTPPRPDREAVALETLMQEAGFRAGELALLQQAKRLSDDLVALEERAMNAVAGIFVDSAGAYTRSGPPDSALAAGLLHGNAYHAAKAAIMAPIEEFVATVEARTATEVTILRTRGRRFAQALLVLVALGAVLLIGSVAVGAHRMHTLPIGEADAADAQKHRVAVSAALVEAWPLMGAAAVASVVIVLGAWWGLARLDDQTRRDTGDALTTVLEATSKAAKQWFRQQEQEASIWAIHPEIVVGARELRDAAGSPAALRRHPAQALLADQLALVVAQRGYEGYLLVSPSGQVLAGSDASAIGGDSEIPTRFLQEIVRGPRYASATLPGSLDPEADGTTDPSMLIGAAIRDEAGAVLGALAFRINPEREFTEILQRGRIGESGESYAFNRAGQLISLSRFDDQLRAIGLIDEDERGVLNIEIRDPGGDMVRGYRPAGAISEQPLTEMATSAVRGESGLNVVGYNDYRGVPVIGAWSWDEALGLGVTTEIDVVEAYASLYSTRRLIVVAAALMVLLVLALTALFLWNRVQMMRAQTELGAMFAQVQENARELAAANEELENINSVVLRWDPHGTVAFINDFGRRLLGYSDAEIVGQPVLGTIVPETESTGRSLATMLDEIASDPGKYVSNESEVQRKDGSRVWMAWRNKPLLDEGGRLREILTIGIDITARKRLEERLRQQSAALEAAADAIVITDTDGTIQWVNPAFTAMTGFTREEAIGQNPRVLKSGMHGEADYRNLWTTITAGRMWSGEIVNRRKDGTLYTEEMVITPVGNEKDVVVSFVAIKRDVTERKAAEQRFRSVTDSASDAIISADAHSRIIGWNRAAGHLFGWSETEILGRPIETVIPERFRRAHREGMDRVAAGGAHRVIGRTVEMSGLHRDGHEFPVEMSLSTWKIGEESLFTGIVRDITERKRLEAELERARRRMEDELNVGREIQMGMLPLIFPPYPMRHEFDIHATLRPAREVGGDFYDFYLIDEDRLCFVVGDVSGKGVPAALFMAVTKTLIESRARNDSSPASILTHVNNELSRHNDASMFVTVFIGMLDVRTGRMSYANGGHNPPYIKRADGSLTSLRERHGPVLGAMEDMVYREGNTTLEHGDRVFVFTDGVTEAMNITQSLYGEPQLVHMLKSETLASAENLVEGVVHDVLRFQGNAEQADDITVLALQYHGGREKEESRVFALTLTNRLAEIQRLNAAFTAFADEHAVPAAARRSGNIVFDELINNVISYAFDDQTEHTIDVRIELTPRRLVISITDDGRPFNPFQMDPPDTALSIDERGIGGLGVHLVRKMMDEVSYNRRTGRNVVTLVKYLDPQDH